MAERGPGQERRLTVGLVTANIHLGVGATLWSGVLDAAEREDVNVVCFPGNALRPGGGDPRNAVYDLIDAARLDGAICWSSTLGVPAADEDADPGGAAARLARRLGGLRHVVSLNRVLTGHETLRLDSYAGMRDAVGHLVEHHGRRRLACLRGPLANPVSRDRFRAYADALTRYRLPRDHSLVSASLDYAAGAGATAMGVLLDVRGLRPGRDFDAVVACSDVLAADALRFLAGRGIRVPDDIAVIGFNDSLEARISDPPLTSVSLPFAELGSLAVDTLLARLRGNAPPARRVVPGTLVTRRSCGCHSPLVSQGEEDAPPPEGPPLAADLAAALTRPGAAFLNAMERHIADHVHTFEDAAALDRALLRERAGADSGADPGADSGARSAVRIERLLGQARLMVADKSHRLLEYERWTNEQQDRRLRELATALTAVTDTAGLTDALDRHLPALGVPGCRLAIAGEEPPAGRAAGGLLPADHRFTAVLEPLHLGEERLGHAVFDAGPREGAARNGALYRALGDQISAALGGVRLFTEVRRARDAAERASRFKTRLLDNATDELRTPVEAILAHTRPGDAAHEDAGRLLRLIDDLLDLSRSEIDALALRRRLTDPRPLLAEALRAAGSGGRPHLPRRLPAVLADAGRLRQILHNLLTVAAGERTRLTVRVGPARLTVLVTSPDLALPAAEDDQLFHPFATGAPGTRLGLAIARRLAVLHGGTLAPHRGPGGSGFHLTLPLPTPAEPPAPRPAGRTLLVAADGAVPAEFAALARDHGLDLHRLHPDDDLAALLAPPGPAAVAWDTGHATAHEWSAVRRLHDHPALRHTPFLLYGEAAGEALDHALGALKPSGLGVPVVVADGSAARREEFRRLLPEHQVRAAADGTAALALIAEEAPGLLIVNRALPDMDGFDLVERLPGTPALMIGDQGFTAADARRADPHPGLVLLGRDILTGPELVRLLAAMTARAPRAADPAPVRHALACIEQHYRHRLTRWQIAQAAGVSEDHLGRLFHREIGVTLWEYLTRLRIRQAKERLQRSDDSVQTVARAVGFHDRAYFSRVFRRLTGVAPHAYRDAS
ncbi:substrate-binding domain-containing protein [Streptomyces sp. MP131-18]|uniref:substrate-binding domain-containing protein n=1 Tax=Streptomyces sp. MP131-18 TaxID=1857892 RepID=UPI00097C7A69|nr:substrate-binding domain-containing protein [Streptomyces sp. MP131-18]ONK12946.1 Aerobic respiration control sensor protein ArcB [Streptomyces sp. MP131-18]